MSFYPPKVEELFLSPRKCRKPDSAETEGTGAAFECGTFIRVALQVGGEQGFIDEFTYQTNGCGFMIAAAEALGDLICGKGLKELGGLEQDSTMRSLETRLGQFPLNRLHCAAVVIEAAKAALADHRRRRLEEFQGEKALICTCFSVSEETLVSVIERYGLTEIEQVSELTRAGSGCGACRMMIRELLDMSGGT